MKRILMKMMMFLGGHLDELQVIEYALDGLEGKARAMAEKHLLGCAMCRDAVRQVMPMADGLAMLAPEMEPPADLADKVLAHVRSQSRNSG